MQRINVYLSDELAERLRRYIVQKYGYGKSFYGKLSEVVRDAIERLLDEELQREE